MKPLDQMTLGRGVNDFIASKEMDLLKCCWFFSVFDLQNSDFMWFKSLILWGNLHRLSWVMVLARLRCVGVNVRGSASHPEWTVPPKYNVNQGCNSTDLSGAERFPADCLITQRGQLIILINNENNSKGNCCWFIWLALVFHFSFWVLF